MFVSGDRSTTILTDDGLAVLGGDRDRGCESK